MGQVFCEAQDQHAKNYCIFWSFWPPQAWLLLLQSQEPSLIWGNYLPKPPKSFSHFSSKLLKPTLSTLSTMLSRLNPRQVEEDMDLVLVPGNHNMDENDVQLYIKWKRSSLRSKFRM